MGVDEADLGSLNILNCLPRDHRRRKVNKSGGAELMREQSDRVGVGRGLPNEKKF